MSSSKDHMVRFLFVVLALGVLLLVGCKHRHGEVASTAGEIMTVRGSIPADSLGLTLIHEHVFLDWTGADSINFNNWNTEEAFAVILPYLEEMKDRGVQTFLECTPAFLGRHPELLLRLSNTTGLQILTNTGYYAARRYKYIPRDALRATAQDLANHWIMEFERGISGTGIRPGFIKIGMDSKSDLTPMDEKLVRAAARTHLATGMTIVAHTGTDTTAVQELEILEEEGVSPEAFVWTHAQNGTAEGHVRLAKRKTWVSLDGMGWIAPDPVRNDSSALFKYVDFLENLKDHGLLEYTLIAHDAGWYNVGWESQENYKPYTPLFDVVMPTLLSRGFTAEEFRQMLVENPKKAYALKVRKIEKE